MKNHCYCNVKKNNIPTRENLTCLYMYKQKRVILEQRIGMDHNNPGDQCVITLNPYYATKSVQFILSFLTLQSFKWHTVHIHQFLLMVAFA